MIKLCMCLLILAAGSVCVMISGMYTSHNIMTSPKQYSYTDADILLENPQSNNAPSASPLLLRPREDERSVMKWLRCGDCNALPASDPDLPMAVVVADRTRKQKHLPIFNVYTQLFSHTDYDPNFVIDFLGIKTSVHYDCEDTSRYAVNHASRRIPCIAHRNKEPPGALPVVEEEYFEMVDTLTAAYAAAAGYIAPVFVELGARYGTWAARAGMAYKLLSKKQPTLVGVEADAVSVAWMRKHFEVNGFSKTIVHHGAIMDTREKGANCDDLTWEDSKNFAMEFKARQISHCKVMRLADILKSFEHVAYVDMDIQHAEKEVVQNNIDLLTKKVGMMHIGTHSPAIHTFLENLLRDADWVIRWSFPPTNRACARDRCAPIDTSVGPVDFNDGALGAFNPRLYDKNHEHPNAPVMVVPPSLPPSGTHNPYLSIVVVTRNDGDAALRRLQNSIDYNLFIMKKYGVNTEYIVVDYNSDPMLPSVRDQLTHRDGLRVLVVPPELAASVDTEHKLLEYFGKNIGIRRAQGKYILVMNIDNMMSEATVQFIAKKQLREDVYYRTYRAELTLSTSCNGKMNSEECISKLAVPVKYTYGPLKDPKANEKIGNFNPHSKMAHACSDLCDSGIVSDKCMRVSSEVMKYKLSPHFDISNDYGSSQLFTFASGDFLLMSASAWNKVGGYHELPAQTSLDGFILCKAASKGLTEIGLWAPCINYHQNHPSKSHAPLNGWNWSAKKCLQIATNREPQDKREYNYGNISNWGRPTWLLRESNSAAESLQSKIILAESVKWVHAPFSCKSVGWDYELSVPTFDKRSETWKRASAATIRELCGYGAPPMLEKSNNAVYVDVGANFGLATLPYASKGWTVFAFEPVRLNMYVLKANTRKYSHVYTFHAAVSDKLKTADIFVPKGQEDNSAVGGATVADLNVQTGKVTHEKVEFVTLDNSLLNHPDFVIDNVRVIKIDTQGHEINVLKGMRRLSKMLPMNAKIIVENDDKLQRAAGRSSVELVAVIRDLGFECWCDGVLVPAPHHPRCYNIEARKRKSLDSEWDKCKETKPFKWVSKNLGNVLQSYFELVAISLLKHCALYISPIKLASDSFALPQTIVPKDNSFLWSGEPAPTSVGPPGGLWHTPASRILHAITPVIQDVMQPLLYDVSLNSNHIVIHFRCSDSPMNRHWGYEFLRYKYYFAALQLIQATTDMPIMILSCTKWSEDVQPTEKECAMYAKKLVDLLKQANYVAEVVCGKSVEEDFSRMAKAPRLISGGVGSSLSYMAALASRNVAVIPSTIPTNGKRPSVANHAHKKRDGLHILHLDDMRLPHTDVKDYLNVEAVHSQLLQGYEPTVHSKLIPQIIHQFWTGKRPPPFQLINKCKSVHKGWKHMLWGQDNITSGQLKLYNQKIYDCEPANGQSDVLRYEVLNKYGGFWIDADAVCLRSLETLRNHSIVTGYESFKNPSLSGQANYNSKLVGSVVIGAVPNHRVLNNIIKSLNNNPKACRGPAWVEVGPMLLTKHLNQNKDTILPFYMFTPYHHTETIDKDVKKLKQYNPFTVNLWGTTFGVEHLQSRIDMILKP